MGNQADEVSAVSTEAAQLPVKHASGSQGMRRYQNLSKKLQECESGRKVSSGTTHSPWKKF